MRLIPIVLLLSGCITTQTAVPIHVQVPVPCLTQDQLPIPATVTPDADLAKLPDGDLVLTIASERLDLKRYQGEAQAVLTACVKP